MAYPLLIRAASLLTESTSASRLPHHFTYALGLILSEQGGGGGREHVSGDEPANRATAGLQEETLHKLEI